ncbi:MAG: hypothetical protein WC755_09245 [Candidatus Woesearchaeota archaeon]|jgi:hypothetical protein
MKNENNEISLIVKTVKLTANPTTKSILVLNEKNDITSAFISFCLLEKTKWQAQNEKELEKSLKEFVEQL